MVAKTVITEIQRAFMGKSLRRFLQQTSTRSRLKAMCRCFCVFFFLLLGIPDTRAADNGLPEALNDRQWAALEKSVDRGLHWLAKQQRNDGSFEGDEVGQPAITSFAVMAYLSRGHRPGVGLYDKAIESGIDFVLATQRANGLFTYEDAVGPYKKGKPSHTATYNHAIAGLMLGEVYGLCDGARSARIRQAIELGLDLTWKLQFARKDRAEDRGGWRYLYDRDDVDSDLSVSGWHLMFLRLAKNAEFDVPREFIDAATGYIKRCYIAHRDGIFTYSPGDHRDANEAMTGIGALSLALGGLYKDRRVVEAGDWLLDHPLDHNFYRSTERYYYTAYYCTQAMAQLGGKYWKAFYPVVVAEVLDHQDSDGNWRIPSRAKEDKLGEVYFTSLAILTLTPPYQLLPIYQR